MNQRTFQLFLGRDIGSAAKPERDVRDYVNDAAFADWQTSILDNYLDGYIIQHAENYWHGVRENTIILTLVCTEQDARFLAKSYCRWFGQEAVGIVALPPMQCISNP